MPSRFEAISQKIFEGQTSRFEIRPRTTGGNVGRFSARAGREAGVWNGFNAIRTPIVVVSPARLDARAGMTGLALPVDTSGAPDQGPISELFLDWDTVAPVSPPEQYAIP